MLEVMIMMQLSMGTYDNSLEVQSSCVSTSDSVTVLRGNVTAVCASIENLFREEDPSLLRRCDVQDFLSAKNPKLRRDLLKSLYEHGCIDWKFLGKLSSVSKKDRSFE